MPLYLTRTNLHDLKTDAKVIGSCPYASVKRNASWQPDLWAEQRRIEALPVGESMMTSGQQFDAKYGVITKTPIWEGGSRRETLRLAACYDSALRLAHRRRCRSIAFPLLSGDCHGFPRELALKTAMDTVGEFLTKYDLMVYLSVRDSWVNQLPKPELPGISPLPETLPGNNAPDSQPAQPRGFHFHLGHSQTADPARESFSKALEQRMEERDIKEPELCQKANLERRVVSKIRSDSAVPGKNTVLALALALELNLKETEQLLKTAGYGLSDSSRLDVLVKYYIQQGNFRIFDVNRTLFLYEQPQLGED